MSPRIAVVLPCFNEASRLNAVRIREFVGNRKDVMFVLVNDGSTDKTLHLLEKLHSADPGRFAVCNMVENRGKAEAVRQGVLRAFESGPDYVAYWDADLAAPLEMIPRFRELLECRPKVQLTIGIRAPGSGRRIERRLSRRLMGRPFAHAASWVLGERFYDTQCGAKMFRATPEMRAVFEEPFLTRWIFDVEIIARLIRNRRATGLPPAREVIYELPLDEWRDIPGSQLRPRDFAQAAVELLRIHRHYRL